MTTFLEALGFGLVTAAILALAAVALSVQLGVTSVPNFAHGELLTFGAYGALVAQLLTRNLVFDAIVGMAVAGITALGMNRFILQPFIKVGTRPIFLLIVTAGLSLILQNSVILFFPLPTYLLQLPADASQPYNVGPFIWTRLDIVAMVIAIVAMVALYVLLKYTKFGKAQRAVAESRELALVSGVPVDRVVNLTWLIVGLLAGLSGVIVATTSGSVFAAMGSSFLLPVFAAVVLGGIGKPQGALVAALIMGVAMELAAAYIDASYKQVLAVGVLFLALLFRPYGLFASSSRSMSDPVADA